MDEGALVRISGSHTFGICLGGLKADDSYDSRFLAQNLKPGHPAYGAGVPNNRTANFGATILTPRYKNFRRYTVWTAYRCAGALPPAKCHGSFRPTQYLQTFYLFFSLGAFANLGKVTVSFVLCLVLLSAWNNWTPSRRISMKFTI